MAKISKILGVQSFCFRAFKDNSKVAQLVKDIDLAAIELCGVHVDFDDEAQHEQVIETYRKAQVDIVSIGVETLTNNEAAERRRFEFARKAGAKFMSVHFQPDTYREAIQTAQRLSNEYDVRCAIHNHGGRHWLGNAQMLDHVLSIADDRIGLCLDTAWCLDAHEDPVKWVERFGKRIYGVHIKDFIFDRAGKEEDTVVGKGNLDLPGLFKALHNTSFNGYAVLEYEGDVDNPVPALKECVAQVRNNV